jgi:hypothetical protein
MKINDTVKNQRSKIASMQTTVDIHSLLDIGIIKAVPHKVSAQPVLTLAPRW